MNSPGNGVRSHLVHAYGQTYAIDLVHVPEDRSRPPMSWRPLARPPEQFPGFGQPVLAPADGVVVHVRDGRRDHRSRTSWPALLFLLVVEAPFRELGGPGAILGNHIVLDLGDAGTRCAPISARDRLGFAPAASPPASRSRSAETPGTRANRTFTSS